MDYSAKQQAIERCERELAAIRELANQYSLADHDRIGLLMGEMDWWITLLELQAESDR